MTRFLPVFVLTLLAGIFLSVSSTFSDESDDVYENAMESLKAGHIPEAIAFLEPSSGNPRSLQLLGELYAQQGQFSKARDCFRRTVEANPKNATAWNGLGEMELSQGRLAEARQAFEKSIEVSPDFLPAKYSLSSLFSQQLTEYSAALKIYQGLLEADPRNLVALGGVALCHSSMGMLSEAIADYQRLLDVRGEKRDFYESLVCQAMGEAWYGLGNVPKAIEMHEKSLRINTESKNVRTFLTGLYLTQGDYDSCIQVGSVLVADHPDFIPGRWYMVNCYAKKGKFAEARKECEAILKLNPEHVQAKEYLVSLDKANAQIYEAAGSRFELTAKKAGFKTAKGKNFTLYTDAGGAKAASLKGDVAVDIDNLMRQFSVDSLGRDLTIYMISTSDAYQRFVTDSIVKAGTPYGFSVSPAGLIVVNLQLGYGTFIHELTHILLYRKFGEVPTWISEGVSSLYESFNVHPDGRVSGGINWRLPILQKVIGTSRYISLKTLLSTDDWSKWWAKPGTAAPTGEARYLMYYLQEKTLLDRFLNEYGSRRKDDPSSIRLLEELLGMPLEKFEPIWQDWVQQLSE